MSETPTHSERQPGHGVGYETSDFRLRPFLVLGGILIISAIVGHLLLFGLFSWFTGRQAEADPPPPPLADLDRVPPGPLLQSQPRIDWAEMLQVQSRQINSYGWVDDEGGAVRIPIDRAMDLLAERGLPVRPDAADFPVSPDAQESDDWDSEGGQPPENGETP